MKTIFKYLSPQNTSTKFLQFLVLIITSFICSIIFCNVCSACSGVAGLNIFGVTNLTAGTSKDLVENTFPPNNIYGWNPLECTEKKSSGSLAGTGDWEMILKAKNADKSYFNHAGNVPSAAWSDTDLGSLQTALETYGDLAYQLGRVVGAPWVAIFVQMRYEDPYSVCGKNNFWGNGCPVSRAYAGGASIQGDSLGEGFTQYGKTLTETKMGDELWYAPVLGISDPKEYLEKLGPRWVQGTVDGPGYDSIEGEKASIDVVMDFITNGEGKSIVEGFTDYSGIDYGGASTSSSSSSTSSNEDGSNVTIIGDSITVYANDFYKAFDEKLPNVDIYAKVSKSFNADSPDNESGLTILSRLASNGSLRKKLVFALGSNNGAAGTEVTQADIDKLLDLAKDCEKIILLTNYKSTSEGTYASNNELFKKAADENDKITLIDWKAEAGKDPGKYIADEGGFGVHPSEEGSHLWADLIYDALGDTCTTYEGDYPEYLQGAEPWGSMGYGPGCTFAGCACGATSMAMLTTYVTGQDVFPTDVADLLGSSYYWQTGGAGAAELDKKVCEKYGCEAEAISWSGYDDAINKMKKYLSEGYVIHLSGAGSYPFSGGGHYIGIFSINGDNVMTANSAFGGNAEMNLSDLVHAGLHYDFTIIKGNGSKNTCSNDNCDYSDESSAISSGGLTEEQAQKLAEYYNSGGGADCASGTRENCYNLSMWWLCNFTDVVEPPTNACAGVGTGAEVVGCLESRYNLETGTEPRPYAVFSTTSFHGTIHTGVVVAVEDDGSIMTVEAAYGGWADLSNGLARVFPPQSIEGHNITFAYLDSRVDMSKLQEAVGN